MNEYEETKRNETEKKFDVSIDITRNSEIEALNNNLVDLKVENEQLKGDLAIIAEKELNAKVEKYRIDEGLTEEEKIERVKKIEQKNINDKNERSFWGNKNATYDSQNTEKGGFDSMEEAILEANKMAEYSPEMKKELGKVAKRALKSGNFDYEQQEVINPVTGKPSLLSAWRKPTLEKTGEHTTESLESLKKRINEKKLEQSWKKKE
jgi:hypothetical protein